MECSHQYTAWVDLKNLAHVKTCERMQKRCESNLANGGSPMRIIPCQAYIGRCNDYYVHLRLAQMEAHVRAATLKERVRIYN